MIKISNICLHQNLIFIKFLKILKIYEIFVKIRELFLFCFTMYKENMFTINLEHGREAPSKAIIYILHEYKLCFLYILILHEYINAVFSVYFNSMDV